ncbi:MAG: hypothetical protein HYU66_18670 [Armatimonadetes bacterium]|nr:hypothetical protein [Armatimonadota bacterium]
MLLAFLHFALAAPLTTANGLSARPAGLDLPAIALDGKPVAGLSLRAELRDPATGQTPTGFTLTGTWRAVGGCLRLDGVVAAAGAEDRIADLVVRAEGAELPLGRIDQQPLLLPAGLLGRLPCVSLRVGGEDRLALAVPPDRICLWDARAEAGGVELRFPFGFTGDARPALRMRAPFAVVLYRTDPRWHYRSALEGYYRAFPEPFRPFVREPGGWFFANQPTELPNPQHFAYYEGGPGGWEAAAERGLRTYPYSESASFTVGLPGDEHPRGYDEAAARLAELEKQLVPTGWTPQQSLAMDETVCHEGRHSLLADGGADGAWTGALQTVTLDPPGHEPILIRGWSRAEGVSAAKGHDYSIYVDVTYADGSYLFGQCAEFEPGTHDWQESRYEIRPERPVRTLRVFCLLRGHTGKAWFDDLHAGPTAAPATNWLTNPGFEELRPPQGLAFVRDNVCLDGNGRMALHITDNLSADVGPPQRMNLLRFCLNVDPKLPSSPQHPSAAGSVLRLYDDLFAAYPRLGGCYIDSVSAWSSMVYNTRRDQWLAATWAFTYDPHSRRVASHGRFGMMKLLAELQRRGHPLGKAVFTNIHCELASFPLYLVSDVPGIESSAFNDPDSLFFYRACSLGKPVLLMDFINLHKLDQPGVAETFHANAAQWGELPSTGRFVKEAYTAYGETIHHWMPAIQELAVAGWQPVPRATGAWIERFGGAGESFYTVRYAAGRIRVEDAAKSLLAYDAVSLEPLPARRDGDGWVIDLDGGDPVRVVHAADRARTRAWLAARAARHVSNASKVRGKAGRTPELAALLAEVKQPTKPKARLERLLALPEPAPEDLHAWSERRELADTLRAVRAWEGMGR